MGERTLILHAGMRKTGTTAIQEYLFHQLDHPDFGYFSAGIPNASLNLVQGFKRDFQRLPQFRHKQWSEEQAQSVRARARNTFARVAESCDRPTTILSAESVSTFDADETADLRAFAAQFFDDIRVVCYIRPPASRVESVFQERLKVAYARLRSPVFSVFDRFPETLDAVFGCDSVHYRAFAPEEFPDGSIVGDFLRFAGVPYDALPEDRVNTSLSLPAVRFLYIYRKSFPQYSEVDKALVALLGELPGERFRLHPELVDAVITLGPESRQWLRSRVDMSLDDASRPVHKSAVRGEEDLLAVCNDSRRWLRARLRETGCRQSVSGDAERLAAALRALAEARDGGAPLRRSRWDWWRW